MSGVGPAPARSQPARASSQGDPAQQTLAKAYIAAVDARDVAALRGLLHPAVHGCIDDANRDVFESILARELKERPRSSSYRILSVGSPGTFTPPWPPNLFRYPVEPTHEVQWEFAFSATRSRTVIRHIAIADGAWFVVLPCPTAEGMEAIRRKQAGSEK